MASSNNKYLKNIIQTFVSRSIVLGLNFLLVILTAQFWGAEGRGIISIVMADVAIIVIFNNVMSESAISFMVPKVGLSPLVVPAYGWIVLFSALGAWFFSMFHGLDFFFLFILAAFSSLLVVNSMALVGYQKMKAYNQLNMLLSTSQVALVLLFAWVLGIGSVGYYFAAFAVSLVFVYAISCTIVKPFTGISVKVDNIPVLKQTFFYGLKNEISSLLQFLNYRLSYFLLLFFNNDYRELGVFSVGVSIAESIWVFSRSVSINQYSKLINTADSGLAMTITVQSAKLSAYMSVLLVAFFVLLPQNVYGWVFGAEFNTVKSILIIIIPGIISMAIANIYAHYFSAIDNQKVLIAKSSIGLISNMASCLLFIPWWGIKGACAAVSLSYIVSSAYLAIMFYRNREFNIRDFLFTWHDLDISK